MNAVAQSDIRELTLDEIGQVDGGLGWWGCVGLGLFTGAAVVSFALIAGLVIYSKLKD